LSFSPLPWRSSAAARRKSPRRLHRLRRPPLLLRRPKPEIVVKIGHVAPLTGPIAHLGKDNENGARLAVEDANAKKIEIDGKVVKFELLGEDDQATRRPVPSLPRNWSTPRSPASSVTSTRVRPFPPRRSTTRPVCRRFRLRQPIRNTPSRASTPPSG
jgi:hypothetical protein